MRLSQLIRLSVGWHPWEDPRLDGRVSGECCSFDGPSTDHQVIAPTEARCVDLVGSRSAVSSKWKSHLVSCFAGLMVRLFNSGEGCDCPDLWLLRQRAARAWPDPVHVVCLLNVCTPAE